MEIFAYILALIWSILCLILFFKILGMTNNVEQLAQEVDQAGADLAHTLGTLLGAQEMADCRRAQAVGHQLAHSITH